MFFRKKDTGVSWILVFLGNPGGKYMGTRHNVGFMTADRIEKKHGLKINRSKFQSLTAICELGGAKTLLMKPQTYMNLSGSAVSQAMAFYRIPLEHVLVISDDVSLPVGKLRIRRSGSAGGHNGLKDIIAKCGGNEFPRIKIGVGSPPHPEYDMIDWVLGTFTGKDLEIITEAAEQAAAAAEELIGNGIDAAMSIYN